MVNCILVVEMHYSVYCLVLVIYGWHLVFQILYHSKDGRQAHIAYLVGT
jgi:hypothetical protein